MSMNRSLLRTSLVVFAVAAVFTSIWYKMDRQPPTISVLPRPGFANDKTLFTVQAHDTGNGLARVSIVIRQNGQQISLIDRLFPAPTEAWNATFSLSGKGLKDGPLDILATVEDKSKINWGSGNVAALNFPLVLDNKSPRLSLKTATHYLNQGGSAAVSYYVSENVASSGVRVGSHFYPGFENVPGQYLCLYAFPHNEKTGTTPILVAEDKAGNKAQTSIPVTIKPIQYKKDALQVSDNFLSAKMPQFSSVTNTSGLFETFLKVNSDLRAQNNERIARIGATSSPTPLWKGAFLRLPNAAPRAGYGDHRTYIYQGKKVDEADHLGVDLASLKNSPVPAANSGKVVAVEDIGIYGQTVIIDHGLGLQTLYSHLSEFKVSVGDMVQKGQVVGITGETGMALGDHLHYGMLISGTPVTPIEWWDPKWVKDKLGESFPSAAGS